MICFAVATAAYARLKTNLLFMMNGATISSPATFSDKFLFFIILRALVNEQIYPLRINSAGKFAPRVEPTMKMTLFIYISLRSTYITQPTVLLRIILISYFWLSSTNERPPPCAYADSPPLLGFDLCCLLVSSGWFH